MAKVSMEEISQIEKLNGVENFQLWKFEIAIVLKANELYDVTTKAPPDERDATWNKKDANAQKVIVLSLGKKPLTHVLNCETAQCMWTKLCSIYERDSEQRKCSLMQEFFSYSMDKSCDVATHISRLVNIASSLKALNTEIADSMLISKILVTLPDSYKSFVTAWESTAMGDQTLENLTARILSEEARKTEKEEKENAVAFKTKVSSANTKRRCFKCNSAGHLARACKKTISQKQTDSKKKMFCKICKKSNHLEKDCYFREDAKKKDRQTDKPENKVSFLVHKQDVSWIVDSGTTSHMVNNTKYLKNLKYIQSSVGVAKENESMVSEGTGTVESNNCFLRNVMYIPDLCANLISVPAITEHGGKVIFTKDKVVVEKNEEEIFCGKKKKNGLYEIKFCLEATERSYTVQKLDLTEKWHKRLGHLSVDGMMILKGISKGLDFNREDLEKIEKACETCMKAKQTREPFKGSGIRTERPLQLMHSDVCGPVEIPTWDDKKYILTMLDDYTHFTVIYLLKNKYEVADTIKEYVKFTEAHWNLKLAKLRCDNGREYVNENLRNWCKKNGTEMDLTIPYSPQLNGKAERLNRTLLEKIRALLEESGMKKEMWGEAAYTATYLLNRSPTKLQDVTPYEMWSGKEPNLNTLKIFGCTAYAKILGTLKKLDDRSRKLTFVGYSPKGYRLWDAENKKIILSRDVKFEENIEVKIEKNKIAVIDKMEDNEEIRGEQTEEEEEAEESQPRETDGESGSEQYEDADIYEEDDEDHDEQEQELRKSTRVKKFPEKYNDYVLLTFQQAVTGPEKEKWKEAIRMEKESLKKNNTWKLVDSSVAEGQKILSSKWIFKTKEDGRRKARLVVRGFEQIYGVDFEETFSPVVNNTSLRILFALAVKKNYLLITFDIKTAFLYGKLDEDVYMYPPEGYNYGNKICKLQRALYGLKQAPLKWNQRFSKFLIQEGLEALKSEQCIYANKERTLILGFYVDDGVLLSKNEQNLNQFLERLKKEFETEINKNPKSFLGVEIERSEGNLKLTQKNFSEKLLSRFQMNESKPVDTPLVKCNEDLDESGTTVYQYREAIGGLLYLTTKTRPDLAQAVGHGSRHLNNYTKRKVTEVKRMFRYLNGTRNQGIHYNNKYDEREMIAYCDSDYAGDPDTRKSTSGYVILYCGGPIAWCSRRQPVVATSSTEAEYIAAADCTKEILYLKSLIEELLSETVNVKLKVDNQSAIKLIKNGVINRRSKHIDVKYHFIHEEFKKGTINVDYCESETQLADLFTKPLGRIKFNIHKAVLIN